MQISNRCACRHVAYWRISTLLQCNVNGNPSLLCAAMQGQYQTAISQLKRVLEISQEMGDHVGDADAYDVIADIHTDLNDFDQAAIYYDKYIETMTTEGSAV